MKYSRLIRGAGVASALTLAAVGCGDDTDEFDEVPGNGDVPGEEDNGDDGLGGDDTDDGLDGGDDTDDGL